MELRNLTLDDLLLYEAIHCDPRMMADLGGPLPREPLADKLREDVADTEADRVWVLAIIPDEGGEPAGTVAIWDHEAHGAPITEIGWMVLPEHQGRGLGKRAVLAALEKARAQARWDVVHAFPAARNERSNAMCRSLGFSKIGEGDYDFRGRILHCSHWMLDLRAGDVAQRMSTEGVIG